MASGLPTVVSNLNCFKDFLDHNTNGLIFNHRSSDPARDLELTLRELIINRSFAIELGCKAADKAKQYSLEKVAKMYIEDFESILLT